MQVTVTRGAGKRQGDDIYDELLTDVRAGIERGRQEICGSISNRTTVQASCPIHSFIETGSMLGVTEASGIWPGMCRYFQLNLTLDSEANYFTADTALHVERETKR